MLTLLQVAVDPWVPLGRQTGNTQCVHVIYLRRLHYIVVLIVKFKIIIISNFLFIRKEIYNSAFFNRIEKYREKAPLQLSYTLYINSPRGTLVEYFCPKKLQKVLWDNTVLYRLAHLP